MQACIPSPCARTHAACTRAHAPPKQATSRLRWNPDGTLHGSTFPQRCAEDGPAPSTSVRSRLPPSSSCSCCTHPRCKLAARPRHVLRKLHTMALHASLPLPPVTRHCSRCSRQCGLLSHQKSSPASCVLLVTPHPSPTARQPCHQQQQRDHAAVAKPGAAGACGTAVRGQHRRWGIVLAAGCSAWPPTAAGANSGATSCGAHTSRPQARRHSAPTLHSGHRLCCLVTASLSLATTGLAAG